MGKTLQSITINVPADQVWASIRNFHDMSWAPNIIEKLEVVGDKGGDEPGAKRVLNDAFRETLLELDADNMTFRYSIDDGPSPLSSSEVDNYAGQVQVKAKGDGSLVEWQSTWERNDEATYDFCHPLYVALLDDMKKSLEK